MFVFQALTVLASRRFSDRWRSSMMADSLMKSLRRSNLMSTGDCHLIWNASEQLNLTHPTPPSHKHPTNHDTYTSSSPWLQEPHWCHGHPHPPGWKVKTNWLAITTMPIIINNIIIIITIFLDLDCLWQWMKAWRMFKFVETQRLQFLPELQP